MHPLQGGQVVQVEVRPGDKWHLAGQALHGAHVIGFHRKVAVGRNFVHGAHFGTRLQQHLGGQNHLFACSAQAFGNVQPIGQAQLVAA